MLEDAQKSDGVSYIHILIWHKKLLEEHAERLLTYSASNFPLSFGTLKVKN